MNDKPWSTYDLEILASGCSNSVAAIKTGRSQAAVRGKRQRLARGSVKSALIVGGYSCNPAGPTPPDPKTSPFWIDTKDGQLKKYVGIINGNHVWVPLESTGEIAAPTPEDPTYEDDKANAGADFWKRQHDALRLKYNRALKEQAAIDQLVAAAKDLAPVAYAPAPPQVRVSGGHGKPQSAVLFLSDTHVGQVIDPAQTMGFGEYNFEMFLARLKFYEEAVTSIMRDHTTTALTELVVVMGGDMLHGALNHAAEVAQHHTLFSQWYGAGHAFAQFLRNLAPLVPRVRVVCTVGNHTRWGNQHKMPTEQRYSNLDSFVYSYTEALTRDLSSVSWQLDEQPVSLFDVQGFRFHLSHGDQLKGGDRALGIPNHAVGRMVSSTNQLFGKDGQPSPHYYLVGHLHRSIVLPHSKGSFIVNGGFPGVDGYGLAAGFSPVDPKQVFFLVHPRYGKTATYDIELKFARVVGDRPYNIPGSFI